MWLLLTGAAWIIVITVLLAVAPDALSTGGAIIIGAVIITVAAIPFIFWGRVLYMWVKSLLGG